MNPALGLTTESYHTLHHAKIKAISDTNLLAGERDSTISSVDVFS